MPTLLLFTKVYKRQKPQRTKSHQIIQVKSFSFSTPPYKNWYSIQCTSCYNPQLIRQKLFFRCRRFPRLHKNQNNRYKIRNTYIFPSGLPSSAPGSRPAVDALAGVSAVKNKCKNFFRCRCIPRLKRSLLKVYRYSHINRMHRTTNQCDSL